jgi:hypothetical protein
MKKEILVVKSRTTFSMEIAIWITWIEYSLMPLHRNLHTITKNLKGRQMHLVEVKRRRHASTVEGLDMWRKYVIRSDTI